eukprot:CAMPEP_0113572568 /NCGR_PEP_ID=MMETSP0015_2-20120614/26158_1 /TAXON_ID=2838 /ORGANISM="Odontella" /LENGTH=183 /DNA_ID=CAMNT_0000475597 /DNA_START=211 /DNA_END=762 /DNA_ORIENTATION=+ /assembly_acc=CAM_ASM_000160
MQCQKSPKVMDLKWGRVVVENSGSFKDVKLYPGGAREWDWGESGTRHQPGIAPSAVDELLEAGATTILLSRGMNERLRVRPDTLKKLEEKGTEVEVLSTRHRQGIALSDIDDLLDAGAQIIILSSGMDKRVHVQGETLKRLKELKSNNDIDEFEILPTKQAVMQYNELAEEEKLVGTLFHSTC